MVEYRIRRALASIEDALAIAQVEAATLGDSDLTAAEMQSVLSLCGQFVYLAFADENCIGLLATFETPSPAGPRLELDMLGVVHEWRGRGVATELVKRAIAEGRRRGCKTLRAIVATDNQASRRVFEHAGLRALGKPCQLLTRVLAGFSETSYLPPGWSLDVSDDLARTAPCMDRSWGLEGHRGLFVRDARRNLVAAVALLRVQTMAYSGYWIEKIMAEDGTAAEIALTAAAEDAKAAHFDEVGVLLNGDDTLVQAALASGYESVGTYHNMLAE